MTVLAKTNNLRDEAHRQQGDHISFFFFFQNKEGMLIKILFRLDETATVVK
jgi:hypothetical protein